MVAATNAFISKHRETLFSCQLLFTNNNHIVECQLVISVLVLLSYLCNINEILPCAGNLTIDNKYYMVHVFLLSINFPRLILNFKNCIYQKSLCSNKTKFKFITTSLSFF